MDPLTAIGLAASVVQFVQFGLEVSRRLNELNSKHPGEVPRSLEAISNQLPLLLNALNRIKSDSSISHLDFDTRCVLKGMVAGCTTQIAEVEFMINEISSATGDSFKKKIKKVFSSFKYEDKVWQIQRNLHTYISVLILHHVIDSNDMPAPPVDDTFFDVREKRVMPFIERPNLMEQLDEHLHDAARSQVTNPTILLLAGERGVGKTQLVLEYCYRAHALAQFRTVFWLDASTLESLSLGFESMYATIKRSTNGSRTEKINFVTGYLNELWHPWLLVLDNYNPTELYDNIMDFLPSRGYGGILLITQNLKEHGLGKVLTVPKFISYEDQTRLDSLLAQEVQRKNFPQIKNLVNQGADVNTLIWNEWPVLHRACLFGMEDAVQFLLDHGADPNPPLPIRKPICWAAGEGDVEICRILMNFEDVNGTITTKADNQSAFNAAAEKGNLEVAQMIAKRREINLNTKNQYGDTPLQSASRKGHMEMVKFLIEQGALSEYHAQGEQALLGAASSGHFEIVKLLCSEGKVNPNAHDDQGQTALYYAAGMKDSSSNQESGLEMAEFLLERGANPNPTGKGEGALHRATTLEHLKMIQLLLDHGADPMADESGWCPLTTAIKYKSNKAIPLLLEAKISASSVRQTWLDNALRYACRAGDREPILQLLTEGADINTVEKEGLPKGASPLLLALFGGHVKAAQLLVRKGAKQDLADEQGRLPLSVAAENGYALLIRDLIRAGGKPDMKSGPNEDTLLILAVGNDHESAVKVLLENGADLDVCNKFGDMAMDIAEEKGHKNVIELLEGWDKV